jgi:ABC-type multidrug transport system fused ATPase/permease subunit
MEIVNKKQEITFKETIFWLWKFWGELKPLMFLLIILTPVAMWFRACTPILIANVFNELGSKKPDIVFVKDQIQMLLIFSIIHFVMYSFFTNNKREY